MVLKKQPGRGWRADSIDLHVRNLEFDSSWQDETIDKMSGMNMIVTVVELMILSSPTECG